MSGLHVSASIARHALRPDQLQAIVQGWLSMSLTQGGSTAPRSASGVHG